MSWRWFSAYRWRIIFAVADEANCLLKQWQKPYCWSSCWPWTWRRIRSLDIQSISTLEVLRNHALQIDIYLLTYWKDWCKTALWYTRQYRMHKKLENIQYRMNDKLRTIRLDNWSSFSGTNDKAQVSTLYKPQILHVTKGGSNYKTSLVTLTKCHD